MIRLPGVSRTSRPIHWTGDENLIALATKEMTGCIGLNWGKLCQRGIEINQLTWMIAFEFIIASYEDELRAKLQLDHSECLPLIINN